MISRHIDSKTMDIAGSPRTGEPLFLAVGKLRRPHGISGEILMDVWTDFPERLMPGMTLYIGSQHKPLHLRGLRRHGQALLMNFDEYDTPEKASELRNQLAFIPSIDRPALPEGEYYQHQLIGLRVLTEAGDVLGVVTEILETGANDIIVVRPETGPEILIPAADSFVLNISLEHGEMHVRVIPGLLPE
jgi:16S rRNA processing protein RimM